MYEVLPIYRWDYNEEEDCFVLGFSYYARNEQELAHAQEKEDSISLFKQFSEFRQRISETGETHFFLIAVFNDYSEQLTEEEVDLLAEAVFEVYEGNGLRYLYDGRVLWLWLSTSSIL